MIDNKIQLLEQQNQFKEIQLNSLLEITRAINENGPLEHLIRIFSFILKEQLGFQKVLFIQRQETWNVLLKVVFKKRIPSEEIPKTLERFRDITMLQSSNSELLNEFQAIVPVWHEEKPLAYILISKNTSQTNFELDTLNLPFVQTISNIVAVAIENKGLAKKVWFKKE